VDESGGEARTYAVDAGIILKTQRPPRLRPRTSLAKEVFFLQQIARQDPTIAVPRVFGYGREGSGTEAVEYTCMTRMPGAALRHVDLSGPARRDVLWALGASLRRVHRLAQPPFLAGNLFPTDDATTGVRDRLAALLDRALAQMQAAGREWPLADSATSLGSRALDALPCDAGEERVALHANPGPEHTFVDPADGRYSGLIDFGDAYISHPALDLRVWGRPSDRAALFAGYTATAPVSAAFMATWQVIQILTDLLIIAAYPERAVEAYADLEQLSAGL
jgi:aminoglycoside phosphotransferase (APT) family kinase protein